MPASRSPLRHRDYRVVWTGALVSNVGTWMQTAALGFYTAHLTQSAGWSALVAAGEFAPTAILGPVGGALADRWSRRRIMVVANVVQGALAALLTWGMATGRPGAPVLALFALANGCVFALAFPSYSAILPELVPEQDVGAAIGLSSAAWNLGRVVGPLAGALVYRLGGGSDGGITWVLGLNAASFGAVVLALSTITVRPQERSVSPILASILEGFRFVRSDPGLRVTAEALCLNTLFVAPFIGLIPAMVEKELGGGQDAVSLLIGGQGLGAVLTGVAFGRVSTRFGVRRVLVVALAGGPFALILYALSPSPAVAVVPLVLTGALYFAVLSSISTTASLRAPSEIRGRVLSLNQVILGAVYAVSLNVEGQLGDRLGLRQVTIGGAVLCLLVLVVARTVRPGITDVLDDPSVSGGARPLRRR